jgi:anti-sigma B factor antagonist
LPGKPGALAGWCPAGGQAEADVVRLPAEVEYANAGQVGRQPAEAMASGAATVVADLTSTSCCDTAGVREMVRAHKLAVAKGIGLRVVVPARMMWQFTWTGLDRVLAVYPSRSAALAAVGQVAGG